MTPAPPRLYTISSSASFLEVLAAKVLEGFPLPEGMQPPSFTDWTILLPTRRAVREFTQIIIRLAGPNTIFLPKVRAIGDSDEELDLAEDGEVLPPLSQTGLLFLLQRLIMEWGDRNPGLPLAQSIKASVSQRLGLALSLAELVHQLETQEVDLDALPAAYDLELAEHREVIVGLLTVIKERLSSELTALGRTTFAAWRNTLLRDEAQRIRARRFPKPIIAAGSTGTIAATRALLDAIATSPMGAVILPGLDQDSDEGSWNALPPEHAQFAMKRLLEEFGVPRSQVPVLGKQDRDKTFLAAEMLRPTATAEIWSETLPASADKIKAATQSFRLIEARDRHIEARAISLILRQSLESSPKTNAALVTPDRDLASRVRNELKRWNISIDDSAGQPLAKFGLAAAAYSLVNAVLGGFEATDLLDFLKHPEISLGRDENSKATLLQNIEIAILRNTGVVAGLASLRYSFARMNAAKHSRSHPLVEKLDADQWAAMGQFIGEVEEALTPLTHTSPISFAEQLENFISILERLSPTSDGTKLENQAFAEIIDRLRGDAQYASDCDAQGFLINLKHLLETTPFRAAFNAHPGISILGTLEARLLPTDIVILGGLNEGVWPADPDPGPWLNRPMRDILKLAQPEREIGLQAHDFVQGLGHPKVYLTWSKRIGATPTNPSRWILRLKNMFKASSLPENHCDDAKWTSWAEKMDDAAMVPWKKPRPKPDIASRPTRFSVTEIENLLRDPYGVYARRVLKLEPLEGVTSKSDPRLRGSLFHEAISEWTKRQPERASPESLTMLLEAGRKIMDPLMDDPEIAAFWKPTFERMALWLAAKDQVLRSNVVKVFAEVSGTISFPVESRNHTLTARADRIDLLQNSLLRIIDYKTGQVPSNKEVLAGFSPQLLLEAALAREGGFAGVPAAVVSDLLYVKLSGGRKPGELAPIEFKDSAIGEKVTQQFERLKSHLANYQLVETAYLPRRAPKTELQDMPYDHLSRFAEWILAEQ